MITQPQALVVIYIKENPYCDIEEIVEGLGVKKRNWLDYLQVRDFFLFDCVEPNPSMKL